MPILLLRHLVIVALLLSTAVAPGARASQWIDTYNRLLAKYVTDRGVEYAAWKNNAADMQAMQEVVHAIGQENVSSLGKKEQLAFYPNAYNAWILHEALAKYPTKSIKDPLFTFFLIPRIQVAGEKMSFNHLEKDIIRRQFNEPRVHFALNCASQSCPPLNKEAFRGAKLDRQLETLAVGFVNEKKGVDYVPEKNSAALSMIFNWYKDDFKPVGGALAFINQRRKARLPNDVKITYQEYDWGLNDVR